MPILSNLQKPLDSTKFSTILSPITQKQEENKMALVNGLFHKDLGLPISPNRIIFNAPLNYSNHALNAANNDRYGKIKLPAALNTKTDNATLIELETKNGKPFKGVYRMSHCAKYDIVIVLLYETRLVKTVWLNSKQDAHKTLDASKYTKIN